MIRVIRNCFVDDKGRVINSLHYPHLCINEFVTTLKLPFFLHHKAEHGIIGQDFLAYDREEHIPEGWGMMPRRVAYYARRRTQRKTVIRFPLVPVRKEGE